MATPWTGRNVFVTGAGGFVGGHVAARLVASGAEVVALLLDRKPVTALDLLCDGPITRVYGDLCDPELLERVVLTYGIDSVFHLAAQALVGVAARGPVPTLESNIRGTWLLLEACRRAGTVQRIAVASSDKAYGPQPSLPYTEDAPLHGLGPYDASKVCTDVLTRMFAEQFGLAAAVTRCANIYGPADLHRSRLIPELCRAVIAGRRPQIRSDGTPTRDYLYIDDAVSAYLMLAEQAPRDEVRGRAFNFGNGVEVSVLELVKTMIRVAGVDLEPEVLGQASGEIDRQVLDSSLARAVLGWQPAVPLQVGLGRTLDWTREFLRANG
jgi:CDP-glucose 4,6-dehydratase